MTCRITLICASAWMAGCAAKPQELCAELVPDTWVYVGADAALDQQFSSRLPQPPLSVRGGRTFGEVRYYWYRAGEDRLMACTLGKGARDNCSLHVNEFVRINGEWWPGAENAVLCNVLATR